MSNVSKRNLLIGGVLCLVLIGVIAAAMRPQKRALGAPASVTPDVAVVQVEQGDVPIYGECIGTLDGLVNADVRAQVTGYLQTQGYQEGAFVKKGQLLFQIDPVPYRLTVEQATADLSIADPFALPIDPERLTRYIYRLYQRASISGDLAKLSVVGNFACEPAAELSHLDSGVLFGCVFTTST